MRVEKMSKILSIFNKVRGNNQHSRGWVYFALMLFLAAMACNLPGRTPPMETSPTPLPTDTVELPVVTETIELIDTEPPPEAVTEEPPVQVPPEILPTLEQNLATGKSAYASNEQAEFPAGFAIDGSLNSMWNSGGQAPQWIEIDLGGPAIINRIRLHVAQSPGGQTDHELSAKRPGSGYEVVHIFSGPTDDGLTLEFAPDNPLEGYRFLRIRTLSSPSWVAWKEIELVGTFE
jgi:hypothetical protein